MPHAQTSILETTYALRVGWREFKVERPTYGSERSRRLGFYRYVTRQTDVDLASATAQVVFCERCELPALEHEAHDVRRGHVCTDCLDHYARCYNCDTLTDTGMQVVTLAQTSICNRCANSEYRFCQTCRGHYRRVYRADHNHGTRSCCVSPERTFTVPYIGNPPLQNDARVSISLPSGEISDEGIELIRGQLINQQYYAYDDERSKWRRLTLGIDELGATWQTKQGNWPKRLSGLAYKNYQLKVPPSLMTLIGNIARDNSHGIDFHVEVTRELNRGARAFGYPGSCWWQSYSRSRCALKTNGGFAIRSFTEDGVSGRAWVMPLKRESGMLTPTFDTMTPDAYVLFNGYGKMTGYASPRVLSHMTGLTYRKISFTCSPMYVNSSAGYLVAAEELAKDYTDGSLTLGVPAHSTLFDTENRVLLHA